MFRFAGYMCVCVYRGGCSMTRWHHCIYSNQWGGGGTSMRVLSSTIDAHVIYHYHPGALSNYTQFSSDLSLPTSHCRSGTSLNYNRVGRHNIAPTPPHCHSGTSTNYTVSHIVRHVITHLPLSFGDADELQAHCRIYDYPSRMVVRGRR